MHLHLHFDKYVKSATVVRNSSSCSSCKQEKTTKYEHYVECILEIEDGIIECNMHNPQLKECCPLVAKNSSEAYSKRIFVIVHYALFKIWHYFLDRVSMTILLNTNMYINLSIL